MAIVSRGGRVIDPNAPQREAQGQAFRDFGQAAQQAAALNEQRRQTQLSAVQEQADFLLAKFGGRAFEVAPDLMNTWSGLSGVNPRSVVEQIGWTPDQEYEFQQWRLGNEMLRTAQETPPIADPVKGQQPQQMPSSGQGEVVSYSQEGRVPPQRDQPDLPPPGVIRSNINLSQPRERQTFVLDPEAQRNIELARELESNASVGPGRSPHAKLSFLVNNYEDAIKAADPTGDLWERAKAQEELGYFDGSSLESSRIVQEIRTRAQQAQGEYARALQPQTTVETSVTPLFQGENSLFSTSASQLQQELEEGKDVHTAVNNVLKNNADVLFGENAVVRNENGEVTGVRSSSGEVYPIESLGPEFRSNRDNFYKQLGYLSGGEVDHFRQALYDIARGNTVQNVMNRVDEEGNFLPYDSSLWGQGEDQVNAAELESQQPPKTPPSQGEMTTASQRENEFLREGPQAGDVLEEQRGMFLPSAADAPMLQGDPRPEEAKMALLNRAKEQREEITRREFRELRRMGLLPDNVRFRQIREQGFKPFLKRAAAERTALGRPQLRTREAQNAYAERLRRLVELNPDIFEGEAARNLERRSQELSNEAQRASNEMQRIMFGFDENYRLSEDLQDLYENYPYLQTGLLAMQMLSMAGGAAEGGDGQFAGLTTEQLYELRLDYLNQATEAIESGEINEESIAAYLAPLNEIEAYLGLPMRTTWHPGEERMWGLRWLGPKGEPSLTTEPVGAAQGENRDPEEIEQDMQILLGQ